MEELTPEEMATIRSELIDRIRTGRPVDLFGSPESRIVLAPNRVVGQIWVGFNKTSEDEPTSPEICRLCGAGLTRRRLFWFHFGALRCPQGCTLDEVTAAPDPNDPVRYTATVAHSGADVAALEYAVGPDPSAPIRLMTLQWTAAPNTAQTHNISRLLSGLPSGPHNVWVRSVDASANVSGWIRTTVPVTVADEKPPDPPLSLVVT